MLLLWFVFTMMGMGRPACGRGLKKIGLLLPWFMFSDGYGVAHNGV